jgi:hypothetical protein
LGFDRVFDFGDFVGKGKFEKGWLGDIYQTLRSKSFLKLMGKESIMIVLPRRMSCLKLKRKPKPLLSWLKA